MLTAGNVSGFCKLFWGVGENQFFASYTKILLLQLSLNQISKDQSTVSVKLTSPVGGDKTVDFK